MQRRYRAINYCVQLGFSFDIRLSTVFYGRQEEIALAFPQHGEDQAYEFAGGKYHGSLMPVFRDLLVFAL
ncbi:MAG: hypothetical protein IMF26_00200 [Candidatus Fermentithermobacillus carboniphilus]|uniref:Uncharacterized protein n=1 Tax=Candidatus Fermentithermobacillus carboniphilus TaxID=3085328 RepID=A0AAT9LD80_9FIRM|nr:MAG: hypothetical protein IMF26_00200 [Candidatus Fermentithermobacillus carboniphilus]